MKSIIEIIFHVLHLIFAALCNICRAKDKDENIGEEKGEETDEEDKENF